MKNPFGRKKEHVIDCGKEPLWAPSDQKPVLRSFDQPNPNFQCAGVYYHKLGEKILWDPKNFKLRIHPKRPENITFSEMLDWVKKEPIMNANVLDYWLLHPEMVPEECKGENVSVFFWGTVYLDTFGGLFVRCYDWNGYDLTIPEYWLHWKKTPVHRVYWTYARVSEPETVCNFTSWHPVASFAK
jgi:hypothetical protein